MNPVLLDKPLFTDKVAQDYFVIIPEQIMKSVRELAIYVKFKGGANAGVVKVESGSSPDFLGTWAAIGTVNWATDNTEHLVAVTGTHKCVRVRISTAIGGGGTCDAWAVAN